MIKKGLLIFFLVSLCSTADCAVLKKLTFSESPDKLRLVLFLDGTVSYKTSRGNSYAKITFPNTKLSPGIRRSMASKILDGLIIEQKNQDCEINANYRYLTSFSVFALKKPNRVVIDFAKLSKMAIPKIVVPEIKNIYTKSFPDKFKIIVYLTSFAPYRIASSEGGLIIELPDTNSIIRSRKIVTKDRLIPKVAIDQVGKSVLISIAQNYPSFYQIYKVDSPPSLVIEFDKTSKSTIASKQISTGLRYLRFIKGTEEGPSTVNALIVDQTSLEVFPYMSKQKEEGQNIFSAIGSVFTFWIPKEETKYQKDTVGNMVRGTKSFAGVNGTFFGHLGEPLGVLMINGELVSYSIYDRTALIIDKNNACYIDNISLSGETSIEGLLVQISGINSKRGVGEAVIYTPRYGKETDEESPGIVLSVIGNEVKHISRAHAWIPIDGYALSLDPSYYDTIGDKVKIGSKIHTTLKIIALSAIPNLEIKHLIGGGPRLLKSGQIYISKYSEHFKSDIAKGRAARTAVGITRDGLLAFATVDKCKQGNNVSKSVGVSLEELAQVMKDLGCVDAMNLDGGSSSTMVISSEVINRPSSGAEKPVSNGILIR